MNYVDECQRSPCVKSNMNFCINTPGSYRCDCSQGLVNDLGECKDIDECTPNNECDPTSSYCYNTYGSYECRCKDGYEIATKHRCEDIDECESDHRCDDTTSDCQNTIGGYDCKCKSGYEKERGLRCKGSYRCECSYGYAKQAVDSDTCTDINECIGNHSCDTSTTQCLNTDGAYDCACLSGYKPRYFSDCEDLDECSTSQCDENTTKCTNVPGTYACTCLAGFKYMSRLRCEDIDECTTMLHHCGKMSTCSNTIGSFDCSCPKGTEKFSFQHAVECQDIDECKETNECDLTVSFCLNMPFGYICQCHRGYVNIDNFTCRIGGPTTLIDTTFIDIFDLTTTEKSFSLTEIYESHMLGIAVIGCLVVLVVMAMITRCIVLCMRRGRGGISETSSSASDNRSIA